MATTTEQIPAFAVASIPKTMKAAVFAKPGLIVGHEPVGVIAKLGAGVSGYVAGQRVIVGAITPSGLCHGCLEGDQSQCGTTTEHGFPCALGRWRF